MRDRVWVKAQFSDFSSRTLVIVLGGRRGEEKLRFAFGRVSFHGHNDRGPNQDAILTELGSDQGTFLDVLPFSQLGGNYDRCTFSDFDRLHSFLGCQYIRISVFQAEHGWVS